jgi:hypothetical protein
VGLPLAMLAWAWGRLRRALHLALRTPPAPVADAPPPTSFSFKSRLWPVRHRWMAAEGQLTFDDQKVSFHPAGLRRAGAVSAPWSSLASLQLRPRIDWGRVSEDT